MEVRKDAKRRKAEPMRIERNLSLDRYEVYLAEWAHGDYYKRQNPAPFDTRQEAEEYVRREGRRSSASTDPHISPHLFLHMDWILASWLAAAGAAAAAAVDAAVGRRGARRGGAREGAEALLMVEADFALLAIAAFLLQAIAAVSAGALPPLDGLAPSLVALISLWYALDRYRSAEAGGKAGNS
ncbi:MAG: hypothetical protein RXR01_05900 [Thermoproteus sp.]